MREPLILCLIGPAGSGKTTNLQRLIKNFPDNLKNSVSVTTRTPRSLEVDGETREFVSASEFQGLIKADLLFEYEEIHGNFYGTRRSTIENAFAQKYDLVFDIDIQGAFNLKKHYPKNTVIIFIAVPNQQELIDRMKGRDTVTQEELTTRLNTANMEYQLFFDNLDKIDYFTVNQIQEETYQSLSSILIAERMKLNRIILQTLNNYVSKK